MQCHVYTAQRRLMTIQFNVLSGDIQRVSPEWCYYNLNVLYDK